MDGDCLVCREVAGEIDLPGGLLWNDENVVAFHIPPLEENPEPYLGHCMVVTRRHVDQLGDLSVAEAESVARASRSLAFGLRAEGAERVHVAVIGTGGDHFHQHLYPRYPGVPPGTSWTALDELPDAPHGDPEAIAAFVARLRAHPPGHDGALVLTNRSAPPATVTPVLIYPDVRAAVAWLEAVFGFGERVRIGDGHRAQMRVGSDGAIVVAEARADQVAPDAGVVTHVVKVRVPDVDAAFTRARDLGARVLEEPRTWEYGERSCVLEDLAGHRWELTQTVRDIEPEAWGGTTVAPW
jgi:uncharacterized glyoxalase superfamily protein PhnB/diadenosine tetraphosphate (Ap4A) HIT family hydrolase